jgi:peptidoglycan/LPS O-acetylase OafA/YrhL
MGTGLNLRNHPAGGEVVGAGGRAGLVPRDQPGPAPRDQPLAAPGRSNWIAAGDGVRGLAVLLVFCAHFYTLFRPWLAPESFSFRFGYFIWLTLTRAGVPLFFVLSGYLVYAGLLTKPQPYRAFLWRRFTRLYPTFLAILGVYLALSFCLPAQNRVPQEPAEAFWFILENLLLLPGVFDLPSIITVSWTLSYQFLFYLALPLVVGGLGLRAWGGRRRAAFFLGVLALCLGCCVAGVGERILANVLLFLCGVLLYEARQWDRLRGHLGPTGEVAAFLALPGALVLLYFLRGYAGPVAFDHIPAPLKRLLIHGVNFGGTFCFMLSCLGADGLVARLFQWGPLRRFGTVSYSFFLAHGLALSGVSWALARAFLPSGHNPVLFWALLPPCFALALAVSVALFVLVEKPFSLTKSPSRRASVAAGLAPGQG